MKKNANKTSVRAWRSTEIEALEPRNMFSSAYTIVDLGIMSIAPVVAEYEPERFMAMNNRGEVVAGSRAGAFLYSAGTTTLLTSLSPKFRDASPLAINDAGQIAGTFPGQRHGSYYVGSVPLLGSGSAEFRLPDAFKYDGKTFRDVGPGSATAITESGDAAGSLLRAAGWRVNGAFVSVAGRRRTLKLPPHVSGRSVVAAAIDGAGDVIVAADHVYLYSTGSRKATQISPLQFVSAAMNHVGQVAGVVSTGDVAHAYIVGTGQTIDLGAVDPRIANPLLLGLNSSGVVVGEARVETLTNSTIGRHGEVVQEITVPFPRPVGNDFAVISHNGTLVDLNTLAPPAETGWTLQAAEDVNDSGQIAAIGIDAAGVQHYLLMNLEH